MRLARASTAACAALMLAAGCGSEPGSTPAGERVEASGDAGDTGPASADESAALRFMDATERSGLAAFVQENGDRAKPYIIESIGGGVALFDADLDGDLDAYLSNGSSLEGFPPGEEPRDALFLGAGDGTFTPAPASAGVADTEWTGGVRTADIDGDGDEDVLLTGAGRDALLRNGGGVFRDQAAELGLADERWTTGAAFLDYDLDGDLDLYVVRYVRFDRAWIDANVPRKKYLGVQVYYGPRGLPGEPDAFYRNDDGVFTDVSHAAGIDGYARHGFQAVAFDHDLDGLVDLYVANDSQSNILWRNGGDGTFHDVADRLGLARSQGGLEQAGMGVAVGDTNGDGRLDLYVTNFSEDYFTLYETDANGFYRDRTRAAGLALPTMASLGWGAGLHDFDLDGDLDLFVANGHVYPQMDQLSVGTRYRQRNQAFENLGDGSFRAVAASGGLLVEESSRGAAFGDVDGDGDVDVLVANLDAAPTLLLNASPNRGAAVRVLLEASGGNRGALGARVELIVGARVQTRTAGTGAGFLSSDEPTLTFALPAQAEPARLRVTWPDGTVDEHAGVEPGSYRVRPGAISR